MKTNRATRRRSQIKHWKPGSRGDGISGTLIRVEKVTVNGKKVWAAILKDEDGEEWSVLLGYAVLEKKWEEMSPGTGQRVTITVTGYGESKKGGRSYVIFDLEVEDPKQEEEEEEKTTPSAEGTGSHVSG